MQQRKAAYINHARQKPREGETRWILASGVEGPKAEAAIVAQIVSKLNGVNGSSKSRERGVPMDRSKEIAGSARFGDSFREMGLKAKWSCTVAGLAFLAAFTCVAQDFRPEKANVIVPGVNSKPDANAQMESQEKSTKQQKYEVANSERKKQIADDSTKLLNMAIALKAEVDKTTKDTLSLNVIRKADEIEKLARSVKEKMKLSVGPG